jgi:hypothetical protein
MFCDQNHAPAILPNYVQMHIINSKFLASLYSSEPLLFCFFFFLSNGHLAFHFLLTKQLACLAVHSYQSTNSTGLVHSAKLCCYRKSVCDGVLGVRIFLLCIPLRRTVSCSGDSYKILCSLSHNRATLYVYSRRIY